MTPSPLSYVSAVSWRATQDAHQRRVDELTKDHRLRAAERLPHPVEDFLFTYYSLRPAQLRRWYPGAGVALLDAQERGEWSFHRSWITAGEVPAVTVDLVQFRARRGRRAELIRRLLTQTAAAPVMLHCFGLHEWAMVFGSDETRRHDQLPLRLGATGTDDVVRTHQIRCSHHDAFRFFTAGARPLNLLQPAAPLAERTEQPGCLHATMDLYKWSYQLLPVVPSSLLLDCFLLARDVRVLDMRASPYDLTSLGYPPVAIEGPAGKAEYVAAQRAFSGRGQELRQRLLTVLDAAEL